MRTLIFLLHVKFILPILHQGKWAKEFVMYLQSSQHDNTNKKSCKRIEIASSQTFQTTKLFVQEEKLKVLCNRV